MALTFDQERLLIALEIAARQMHAAVEEGRILDVITETSSEGTTSYTVVVATRS